MAQKHSRSQHDYGQCRCCLKDAILWNMWQNYSTTETEQEIYGKMLVDCFSLSWTIFKKADDDKICDNCILKLKEAISFKDEVNKNQQIMLERMKVENSGHPKLKRRKEDPTDEAKDFEVEYLDEDILDKDNEPKTKRRNVSERSEQIIASRKDYMNNNSFADSNMSVKVGLEVQRLNEGVQHEIHDDFNNKNFLNIIKQELIEKHRDNIRSILIASNATPIKGFWGTTYCCCYCNEKFEFAKDLKNHTYTHEDMPFKLKIKDLTKHVIKLDISFLKCNMCDKDISSLEELMMHVKESHKLPIHTEIRDHIVPFKFEEENRFVCVKCPNEFESFKGINDHMTDIHCRNYECDKCNRGFVNVTALQTHCMVHRISVSPCSFCPQIFETRAKVLDHEISVHLPDYLTVKCSFCDCAFTNQDDKLRHEDQFHKKLIATQIARSIYRDIISTEDMGENEQIKIEYSEDNTANDTEYVTDGQSQEESSMHEGNQENVDGQTLIEDNVKDNEIVGLEIAIEDQVIYKCSDCSKEFDEKFQLLSHMSTHESNKRKHICPSCFKVYYSQYALNDHMKRIHNIKKYFNACELCDKKFRTEQNYLIHMRCIHGLV